MECKPENEKNITCKSKEERDRILGSAKWATYISDVVVDPNNYE